MVDTQFKIMDLNSLNVNFKATMAKRGGLPLI